MSSVLDFDSPCWQCGSNAMFTDYNCRTGEEISSCSVCGAYRQFSFFRDGKGHIIYDRFFIPFSKVKVILVEHKTRKTVAEFSLPQNISQEELEHLAFGWFNGKQDEILLQYGMIQHDDFGKFYACLCYRTKGRKKHLERFNYIGNRIEPSIRKNPSGFILCKCKTKEIERRGYGIMRIFFKGNRKAYFYAFNRIPNIPHILKKWRRLTAGGYDPENSFLSVIKGDELVLLKGHLPFDDEMNVKFEEDDSSVFTDNELPF